MPSVILFEESPPFDPQAMLANSERAAREGHMYSLAVPVGRIMLSQAEEETINSLQGPYTPFYSHGHKPSEMANHRLTTPLTEEQAGLLDSIMVCFSRIEQWDASRGGMPPRDPSGDEIRLGVYSKDDHSPYHRETIDPSDPNDLAVVHSVAFGRGGGTRSAVGWIGLANFDRDILRGEPEDHGLQVDAIEPGTVIRIDGNVVHAASNGTGPRLYIGSLREGLKELIK